MDTWPTRPDEHLRSIYRYIYQHVGNRDDAEELTAQIMRSAVSELEVGEEVSLAPERLLDIARRALAARDHTLYGCAGEQAMLDNITTAVTLSSIACMLVNRIALLLQRPVARLCGVASIL